jgi:flagellar protein FlaI
MNIPRELFQSLDAVVFMGQVDLGGRRARRIKSVTEILDVERENKNLLTNEPYIWNPKLDSFEYLGRSFLMEDIARATGKSADDVHKELERKTSYLEMMDGRNITHYKEVSKAINSYYFDPATAIHRMQQGMG